MNKVIEPERKEFKIRISHDDYDFVYFQWYDDNWKYIEEEEDE